MSYAAYDMQFDHFIILYKPKFWSSSIKLSSKLPWTRESSNWPSMILCVSVIEFGMEGQEIRCFSRKKIKKFTTIQVLVLHFVSLSCHSLTLRVKKLLNWTKLVRWRHTLYVVVLVVVVPVILAIKVSWRLAAALIMTRLNKKASTSNIILSGYTHMTHLLMMLNGMKFILLVL